MRRIHAGHDDGAAARRFSRGRGFGLWTLSLLHAGRMRHEGEGGAAWVGPPSLLLVKPDTPYEVSYEPARVRRGARRRCVVSETWVLFEAEAAWERLLSWPALVEGDEGRRVMRLEVPEGAMGEAVERAMGDMCFYMTLSPVVSDELLVNGLHRLLLLAGQINPRQGDAVRDERVEQAAAWLSQRVDRRVSMEELARAVHLSVSRLGHLFTRQMGCPPLVYHERLRLRHAQGLLLATQRSVSEIAREVGYENAFHFSTRFRKWTGASPAAFRKRQSQGG